MLSFGEIKVICPPQKKFLATPLQRTVTAKWQLLSSLIVLPTENVLLKMREARFAKMANCPAFRFASSTGNS